MKNALRYVAAVPAGACILVAVPLSYYGLAMLFAEVLLIQSGSSWPLLCVIGGPTSLLVGFLMLRLLFPAQFR
jgi:hypothetical protein